MEAEAKLACDVGLIAVVTEAGDSSTQAGN